MPKASKKQKNEAAIQSVTKFRALHNLEPWACVHHTDHSEIEAYVMAKGDWETVAEVKQTAYLDAVETATFIAKVVNEYEQNQKLVADLVSALELCLKCDGLTWEAEQEAEIVITRSRKLS
jgi:hypothetical protein